MSVRAWSILPAALSALALAPCALTAADDPPRLASFTCRDPAGPPAASPGKTDWTAPATVSAGVARLAAELWGKLPRTGNLAISPCSLHACLAMTALGARGETLAQMQRAVSLPAQDAQAAGWKSLTQTHAPPTDAATAWSWTMANALFASRELALRAPFTATCADDFGAAVTREDFTNHAGQAVAAINSWCSSSTKGLIPTIVDDSSVHAGTRLVLADAVYFKAKWLDPFNKDLSTPGSFQVNGDDAVLATFMHAEHAWPAAVIDGAQVVAVPYAGGQLEAVLMVPTDLDGLPALEARLDAAELARLCQAPQALAEVTLSLPRLHLASDLLQLRGPLASLGMTDAFDTARADFSGIAAEPLSFSDVLHRCVIDLDEQGTTAAAATAVVMDAGAPPPQLAPMTITANHPFLLVIRQRDSGTILFLARVAMPAHS